MLKHNSCITFQFTVPPPFTILAIGNMVKKLWAFLLNNLRNFVTFFFLILKDELMRTSDIYISIFHIISNKVLTFNKLREQFKFKNFTRKSNVLIINKC